MKDTTLAPFVRFTAPLMPVRVQVSTAESQTIQLQVEAQSDFSIAMMTLRGPRSFNLQATDT